MLSRKSRDRSIERLLKCKQKAHYDNANWDEYTTEYFICKFELKRFLIVHRITAAS